MPGLAGARMAAHLMAGGGVSSLVASTGRADREPVHERWGPVAAVVLAAGEGSRFGAPKQVVEVDGEPLVVRAVKAALASGAEQVVVVTGAYADKTVACLASASATRCHPSALCTMQRGGPGRPAACMQR